MCKRGHKSAHGGIPVVNKLRSAVANQLIMVNRSILRFFLVNFREWLFATGFPFRAKCFFSFISVNWAIIILTINPEAFGTGWVVATTYRFWFHIFFIHKNFQLSTSFCLLQCLRFHHLKIVCNTEILWQIYASDFFDKIQVLPLSNNLHLL